MGNKQQMVQVSSMIKGNDESFCKRLKGKLSKIKSFEVHSVRSQIFFRLFVTHSYNSVQPFPIFPPCFDATWLVMEFTVSFVFNFDFFIKLLDTCDGGTLCILIFYFRFISAPIFSHLFIHSYSYNALVLLGLVWLVGLCCIVISSMIFSLSWPSSKQTHKQTHTHMRACTPTKQQNNCKSHRIRRFMFALLF